MKFPLKKWIFWSCTALFCLAIGVQIQACWATYNARKATLPENFGNFERVRAALPPSDPGKPFTFVVVGDSRSKGTFEGLSADIDKAHAAFVVNLGDWVDDGTPAQHAYFRLESTEYNIASPFFFVPGNHDVDPRNYSLDQFEAHYGPRNFSFVYNDCIFIFISHLDTRFSNQGSLDYLRSMDREKLDGYRKRFVFMHIPPGISPDVKARHTDDEEEFVRLFEELHVDYVVAADFHGYNRTQLRGVDYIVTGGGGAHLHESRGQQFHHAIALTVGPDFVSERIIPAAARFDVEDWLEMNAVVQIGPFIFAHLPLAALLNVLAAVALRWGFCVQK
jgi:predicted phosphodiesterase